ncbi:NAD(P)-binding domain-containing protein [Variovorax sp. VNK109]|uniref:NAD(P)-binding domain-containing protein n=1 Tax=Variovorax sp. VNK109 TaxID=3400919 RepID=UPI003C0BB97D
MPTPSAMSVPMPMPLPDADAAVQALAAQARAELALLAYPDKAWVLPLHGDDVLDVLVVGGGQSGLGICASLRANGVTRVAALDRATEGQEGVWESFARMPELRTPKLLNGLDLGLPSLSVQRWYAVRFGDAAWQGIDRIPRTLWMDYLRWYRDALQLPVENGVEVTGIRPQGDGVIAVETQARGVAVTRLARLVVLATGTDGGGAWRVPFFVSDALPREHYNHSSDAIDFAAFEGKRIGVLGHGASAFDNAVAALDAGARSVDLCFRRARLPRINPHRHIETAGLMTNYARLSDATRWQVAHHFRSEDQPPPRGSFRLALSSPAFALHAGCGWQQLRWTGDDIAVTTPKGDLHFDHVICATGQSFDLSARPEMKALAPAIARWSDRYTPPDAQANSTLGAHPYLGEHYEFTPRETGHADSAWVSRVFAFNSASYVSHGPHSTSISGHKHALPRLVRGLTQRLFLDQEGVLVDNLQRHAERELDLPDDFEQQQALRAASRFAAMETA